MKKKGRKSKSKGRKEGLSVLSNSREKNSSTTGTII
jgi:hypothetical protein